MRSMKREIWIEREGLKGEKVLWGPYASPEEARKDGFIVVLEEEQEK